jgi:hypothetical protein
MFLKPGGHKIDYGAVIRVPSASPDKIVKVYICPSFDGYGLIAWRAVMIYINSDDLYYFRRTCLYNVDKPITVCLVASAD